MSEPRRYAHGKTILGSNPELRAWVDELLDLRLTTRALTTREIQAITGVGYRTVARYAKTREPSLPPTPTKNEVEVALSRAMRDFEWGQTPENWAKLQDARRAYEDHRIAQKELKLHRQYV